MKTQALAIANLARSIDFNAKLPHQVFTEEYAEVYVTDWRTLIHPDAVKIFKVLMEQEGSSFVVLGRFDRPKNESQNWQDDIFLISTSTEPDAYRSFLTRQWTEYGHGRATSETREPWPPFAGRIGACSDMGTWCMYGELRAEIAVLGSKVRLTTEAEKLLHSEFGIQRLVDALRGDIREPANEHSKRWQAILRSAYLP